MILPKQFYHHHDVTLLAKSLLGKWLISTVEGIPTGGIITETEAYKGVEDKACHAYQGRRTKRTEIMFAAGGVAYVYLCYGIHNMLNIVTNAEGHPHAILIRALLPQIGIDLMKKRRNTNKSLTSGPGALCQALGIDRSFNGHPLIKPPLWLEDRGNVILDTDVITGKRIGIDYAEDHADLPWRFLLAKQT